MMDALAAFNHSDTLRHTFWRYDSRRLGRINQKRARSNFAPVMGTPVRAVAPMPEQRAGPAEHPYLEPRPYRRDAVGAVALRFSQGGRPLCADGVHG